MSGEWKSFSTFTFSNWLKRCSGNRLKNITGRLALKVDLYYFDYFLRILIQVDLYHSLTFNPIIMVVGNKPLTNLGLEHKQLSPAIKLPQKMHQYSEFGTYTSCFKKNPLWMWVWDAVLVWLLFNNSASHSGNIS